MEIKKENWEWVDIKLLKKDGDNPNIMDKTTKEAMKRALTRFGWNMPIITDLDYIIADGEQKLDIAIEMGLTEVPILRKKLTVTDRKIIRQQMNKISGTHDNDLDAAEFKKILSNTDMEELSNLIGTPEQEILNIIDRSEREPDTSETVDRLGHLEVTCPFCKKTFKKSDQ